GSVARSSYTVSPPVLGWGDYLSSNLTWNSRLEKRQGPHLDAFPRWSVRRTCGVVERTVRGPAGAPVFFRLEGFEHDRFVALHIWEVVPNMVWVESHVTGLADPIRINPRAGDELFGSYAARVGNRQRLALHRLVDRPPGLDDGKAMFEKLFRFVGE